MGGPIEEFVSSQLPQGMTGRLILRDCPPRKYIKCISGQPSMGLSGENPPI